MARGLALLGLLITALLVAWLALRSTTKRPSAATSATAAPSSRLGEIPADEQLQNAAGAKKYIEGQQCSASCEGTLQNCLGLADGETAEARCRQQRSACEASCGASGQPAQ